MLVSSSVGKEREEAEKQEGEKGQEEGIGKGTIRRGHSAERASRSESESLCKERRAQETPVTRDNTHK